MPSLWVLLFSKMLLMCWRFSIQCHCSHPPHHHHHQTPARLPARPPACLQLSKDALHVTMPNNDCCCHVDVLKTSIPLDKIQEVQLSQGCCESCFGLHSVSRLGWEGERIL